MSEKRRIHSSLCDCFNCFDNNVTLEELRRGRVLPTKTMLKKITVYLGTSNRVPVELKYSDFNTWTRDITQYAPEQQGDQ
ncbi:hypothetical protein PoB_003995800 [Plakobranchus ocellatus]|uniref:Uncharacterized protein n=1 Tax=Plakobranchus ocellatus TaxID=259542 RepID=A0AAV4B3X0_9GAST|nr:hypothetical protein PoB_003995800 [Plakobranchus ocellatus]